MPFSIFISLPVFAGPMGSYVGWHNVHAYNFHLKWLFDQVKHMGEHIFCNYIISLLCSDLNEDFGHCKYLHTVTVENLKDMKANEVGHLSI